MEVIWSWFMSWTWWQYILFGMALWFSTQNFILPDPWSVWLALRKNGPMALMPFGVLAVVVGVINLVIWLWKSVDFVFTPVHIAPWLWLVLAAGVIILVVYVIVRRAQNLPLIPRRS